MNKQVCLLVWDTLELFLLLVSLLSFLSSTPSWESMTDEFDIFIFFSDTVVFNILIILVLSLFQLMRKSSSPSWLETRNHLLRFPHLHDAKYYALKGRAINSMDQVSFCSWLCSLVGNFCDRWECLWMRLQLPKPVMHTVGIGWLWNSGKFCRWWLAIRCWTKTFEGRKKKKKKKKIWGPAQGRAGGKGVTD